MRILVCTETRSGQLDGVSLEMLGAARGVARTGDEIVSLVVGSGLESAAACLGASDRVIAAIDDGLAVPTAEAYARILRDVVRDLKPDLIVVAYSAAGLDVAPDLAGRTALPLVAYVVGLARGYDLLTAVSLIYGGKVLATSEIAVPAILMINPGVFTEAAATPIDAGAIVAYDPTPILRGLKITLIKEDVPARTDIDLGAAERIVCVGRGIGEESSIELVRELAALLDAEIAGSRPVVDSGWLPKARQVGKSGQRVKPKLYLALGVSGAPEHLEGMSRSELIIAVNTDPKAPIFGAAHYGATCDLFDLVPILTERLRAARESC